MFGVSDNLLQFNTVHLLRLCCLLIFWMVWHCISSFCGNLSMAMISNATQYIFSSCGEKYLLSLLHVACTSSACRCSYSTMAKLDSAVAYVLQRRQWESVTGYKRPGSLLERPSLLVLPYSIRSAAAATSVLRGGRILPVFKQ
jgi:hypothetical protein